jgi:hypothetical protein
MVAAPGPDRAIAAAPGGSCTGAASPPPGRARRVEAGPPVPLRCQGKKEREWGEAVSI